MANQNVDFTQPGATADTGEKEAAAIRPVLDGEPGIQATFQRPSENLRTRTEILRDAAEDAKYLHDADRSLLLHGGGTVTWNGTVISGGNGKFTIDADLTLRPFLAPSTCTKAKATIRGMSFETALAGAVVPRAYSGANKITVQITGSDGAILAVALGGTPTDNVVITVDTNAGSGTTKQQLVDYLNLNPAAGPVAYRALGLLAAIDGGTPTDKVSIDGPFGSTDTKMLAGATDAEKHVLTPAGLATFFTDSNNALAEGDVLAIWYDTLVNGAYGGRRESIGDLPENSANVDSNLFLLRRFPERAALALPIARVVAGRLYLLDGSVMVKDVPANLTGGVAELPPPTVAEPPARFLAMDPGGAHTWGSLDDTEFVGGLHANVVDVTARNAINTAYRKIGMVVYVVSEDTFYTLIGGTTDGNWAPLQKDSRLIGGLRIIEWAYPTYVDAAAALNALVPSYRRTANMLVRTYNTTLGILEEFRWTGAAWSRDTEVSGLGHFGVISGCEVTNPDVNTISIAAGAFYQLDGTKVVIETARTIDVSAVTTQFCVIWDASAGNFAIITGTSRFSITFPNLLFVQAERTGGYITAFLPCAPQYVPFPWAMTKLLVAKPNIGTVERHFSSLKAALCWRGSYNYPLPRRISIVDKLYIPTSTTLTSSTSAVSGGGVVTDALGRFKRDLIVGDLVSIDSVAYVVSAVTTDTSITLTGWSGGSVTGKSLYRQDMAAYHGAHVDLSQTHYFSNAIGRFDGYTIAGDDSQSEPTIYWGNDQTRRPLFHMNGTARIHFEDLRLYYLDTTQNTNSSWHDQVAFKGLGKRTSLTRVRVEGNNALTHAFHLSSDIGGDTTAAGLVLRQCEFYGIGHTMSSYFYVPNTGITGRATAYDCVFAQLSAGYRTTFLIHYEQATPSVILELDNCRTQYIDCAYVAGVSHYKPSLIVRGGAIGCQSDVRIKMGVGTVRTQYDEPNQALTHSKVSTGASVTSTSGSSATISGLVGMVSGDVGKLLSLRGAAVTGNNGLFLITGYTSATVVTVENASANIADGNNGTIVASVYVPADYGAALTIASVDGNGVVTATGAALHMQRDLVGCPILIGGATTPTNNGKFIVLDWSGTTIKYYNPAAVAETPVTWCAYYDNIPSVVLDEAEVTVLGGYINFQGCRTVEHLTTGNVNVVAQYNRSATYHENNFNAPSDSQTRQHYILTGDQPVLGSVKPHQISPKQVARAWASFNWNSLSSDLTELHTIGCSVSATPGNNYFEITISNTLLPNTRMVGGGIANIGGPFGYQVNVVKMDANVYRVYVRQADGSSVTLSATNMNDVTFVCYGVLTDEAPQP